MLFAETKQKVIEDLCLRLLAPFTRSPYPKFKSCQFEWKIAHSADHKSSVFMPPSH